MKEKKESPSDKRKSKMSEKIRFIGITLILFLAHHIWPSTLYWLILPALAWIFYRDVIRLQIKGYEYCTRCRRDKLRSVMCERVAVKALGSAPAIKVMICSTCLPEYDRLRPKNTLESEEGGVVTKPNLKSRESVIHSRARFDTSRLHHVLDDVPVPQPKKDSFLIEIHRY